ncbi:MAG: hypothetical protein E7609_05330, partial [Ruminococcaceae bacterium]|nr:hypothetical protein [Oscillospiraceae bacterium]
MKKRILSLLLLAAMLITAVPVMTASAAEEATPTEEKESVAYVDPHTLYVADGIQNLFTVFGDQTGVDMTAGTWTAKIGEGVATFGNVQYWEQRSDRGVGYTGLYGQWVDGNLVQSAKGSVLPTDTILASSGATLFNADLVNTRLNLGLSLLPKEDFTVEYFAMYNPIYVANPDGTVAKDENGKPIEYYVANGNNGIASSQYTRPFDYIGFISSTSASRDGTSSNGSPLRGDVAWRLSDANYNNAYSWNAKKLGNDSKWASGIREYGKVHTYVITRDESLTVNTVEEEEVRTVTAVYDLLRDGKSWYTSPTLSTANAVNGTHYYDKDDTGNFYLSSSIPTDFYSVRIYDRALTLDEQKQNHAVDVMLYYGLKLPVAHADAAMMELLASEFSSVACVRDGYDDKQDELQAVIDKEVVRREPLSYTDTLYVTDGLLNLFTVFGEESGVDMTAGTWTAKIGEGDATFGNVQYWEQRSDRGVGYTGLYGQWVDGNLVQSVKGSVLQTDTILASSGATLFNADLVNTRLNLGLSLLPKEDFTVEYFAMYNPIYVANPDGTVAKDENGKPIEYYVANGNNGIASSQYTRPFDYIGFISSTSASRDGTSSNGSPLRGDVAWRLSDANYNNAYSWNAKKLGNDSKWASGIREYGKVHTYVITRDESLTVNTVEEEEVRTVTAVYDLLRDGKSWYTSPTLSTANAVNGTHYYDKDDTGNFYLSSSIPTDFYSVRIYDRALTLDEQKQNHAVDVLLYYDIKLSKEECADEELLAVVFAFANACSLSPGATSSSLAQETLEGKIENYISAKKAGSEIISRYAASEDLVAFYTTFIKGTVDIDAAIWVDLVAGKTAALVGKGGANSHPNRWSMNADGSFGFYVLKGAIEADGTYSGSGDGGAFENNIRLEFGLSQLPEGDFTVDYMAKYKPLYVRDLRPDGAADTVIIAKDENDKPIETYSQSKGTTGNYLYNAPIDRMGWFSSIAQKLDGNSQWPNSGQDNDSPAARGHVNWTFMWKTWSASDANPWRGGWVSINDQKLDGGLAIYGNAFQTNDKIRTYSIMVNETVIGDDPETRVTEGDLILYRDGKFFNSAGSQGKVNSTANAFTQGDASNDPYHDVDVPYSKYPENTGFWLSNNRPTDFYAVRVYDRVLTEAEMKHNRCMDLFYYYGLKMDDACFQNEALLQKVFAILGDEDFIYTASGKATTAERLQGKIDDVVKGDNDYAALYVTDSRLVGLYTAFNEQGGVDLVNGTWKNMVLGSSYSDATIHGAWTAQAKGIGYRVVLGEKTWENVTTEVKNYGISLDDAYENLENFTVETF